MSIKKLVLNLRSSLDREDVDIYGKLNFRNEYYFTLNANCGSHKAAYMIKMLTHKDECTMIVIYQTNNPNEVVSLVVNLFQDGEIQMAMKLNLYVSPMVNCTSNDSMRRGGDGELMVLELMVH